MVFQVSDTRQDRPSKARRVAALAGCALLVPALALATAGCDAKPQATVDASGVTLTDPSGAQAYVISAAPSPEASRTVTVSGTDSVQAVPDTAQVTVGVNLQADTAEQASEQVSQAVDEVRAALAAMGVDEDDVATSSVYMYPRYDYSSSVEKIVGYEMNVSLTVKNLSLDEAGKAISTATAAGATSVGGVSYYCSDYDAQYQRALEKALAVAEGKAQAIAASNGDVLGARVSVSEGYDGQVYRNAESKSFDGAVMEAAAADMAGGSLNVDPGTIEIGASVTVVYEVGAKA